VPTKCAELVQVGIRFAPEMEDQAKKASGSAVHRSDGWDEAVVPDPALWLTDAACCSRAHTKRQGKALKWRSPLERPH
jgi:hypothetical protein